MKDEARSDTFYEKLMAFRDRTNAYARMNGIRTRVIREGYAEVEMPVQDVHRNPIHSIHGGCLYTVADVCAGAAAMSYGNKVTTMNSAFSYLRAGIQTETVIGKAEVIKRGKRTIVLDVKILDQDDTILCAATFTFAVLGRFTELEKEL